MVKVDWKYWLVQIIEKVMKFPFLFFFPSGFKKCFTNLEVLTILKMEFAFYTLF